MKIVAIFTVYNERCFMPRVIRHLSEQGVVSYVIDNESTDGTREIAEGFLGRGVIGVETLPRRGMFELETHLKRKEQLHHELGADWYIHHDADEIRQAPKPYGTLAEALRAVDGASYNAVDFHEFAFTPTGKNENYEHERYVEEMKYYCYMGRTTGAKYRINAWKNLNQKIDLASSAGHQVKFEGRRVYPQKFILRHYLALSYDHVLRKYCHRKFSESEVRKGWFWTRATLRPEEVYFPDRSLLKILSADETWDTSDPWTDEPLFKNARPPAFGSDG